MKIWLISVHDCGRKASSYWDVRKMPAKALSSPILTWLLVVLLDFPERLFQLANDVCSVLQHGAHLSQSKNITNSPSRMFRSVWTLCVSVDWTHSLSRDVVMAMWSSSIWTSLSFKDSSWTSAGVKSFLASACRTKLESQMLSSDL